MNKSQEDTSKRLSQLKTRQKSIGEKEYGTNGEPPKRKRGRPRKNQEIITDEQHNGISGNSHDFSADNKKPVGIAESNRRKFTGNVESVGSLTADNGRVIGGNNKSGRKSTGTNGKIISGYGGTHTGSNNSADNTAGFAHTIKENLKRLSQPGLKIVSGIGSDDEDTESFFERVNPIPKVKEFVQNTTEAFIQDELTVFDDEEVEAKRADIVDMIIGWGDDLNKFLTISNKNHAQDKSQGICDIWDLDTQEATAIANIWLKRAKRDEKAAAVLRMAMDGNDYFRTLMILGERSFQTANWYPDNGGFNLTHWSKK
jgi:hypothetical protein